VHGDDQAIHLAGNRIGIDGSDGTDCIKVNADVTFLGRRARNGDFRRGGRGFFRGIVMTPNQHDCDRKDQQQQNPYDPHYRFVSARLRSVGRELMATLDETGLIGVNGQEG
jgi:hypothetical protein